MFKISESEQDEKIKATNKKEGIEILSHIAEKAIFRKKRNLTAILLYRD